MKRPRRGDVYLVSLIRKTRPCVVVSPDELNEHLSTFLVAPMTTGGHSYPFRIACRFHENDGYIVLDRLRTVDRDRLVRHLGRLTSRTLSRALSLLREMFEE